MAVIAGVLKQGVMNDAARIEAEKADRAAQLEQSKRVLEVQATSSQNMFDMLKAQQTAQAARDAERDAREARIRADELQLKKDELDYRKQKDDKDRELQAAQIAMMTALANALPGKQP